MAQLALFLRDVTLNGNKCITTTDEPLRGTHLLLATFMPPIALQKRAVSPSWEIRYLVALHPRTRLQTRQQLSQDGNRYVRAMARANLEPGAGSPSPFVR